MPDEKYCYPNSNVLRNKLNITDKNKLMEAEISVTIRRISEMQINPAKGSFDLKHLCKTYNRMQKMYFLIITENVLKSDRIGKNLYTDYRLALRSPLRRAFLNRI